MFGKTREKLEKKYVEPVQNAIGLIAIVAVLALVMAALALVKG